MGQDLHAARQISTLDSESAATDDESSRDQFAAHANLDFDAVLPDHRKVGFNPKPGLVRGGDAAVGVELEMRAGQLERERR